MSLGRDLNFVTCKRDKASAFALWTPGRCTALNKILFCKHDSTKARRRTNSSLSLIVFLLMTSDNAWLSVWKVMHLFASWEPHIFILGTIGNISSTIMFLEVHDGGIHSYKEFDNEKIFLRLENSPPPNTFSNGTSLRLSNPLENGGKTSPNFARGTGSHRQALIKIEAVLPTKT